jgi:hypothetical protein
MPRRHDLDDRPPRGTRRLEPVPDRPRPLAVSPRSLRRLAPSTAQSWAGRGTCAAGHAGTSYPADLWWPEGAGDPRALVAAQVCKLYCPVRQECLDYAEANDEPTTDRIGGGIWGGLQRRERRALRRSGWRPGMPAPAVPELTRTDEAAVLASEWARWLPVPVLAEIASRWQAAQARKAV